MKYLTSKTLIKTFLGYTSDIKVDNIISTVSSLLLGATNRLSFERQQFTETFYQKRYLTLSALPIVSIDEVKDLYTGAIINPLNYRVDLKNAIVELLIATSPYSNIQVKYTAGYLIDFDNMSNLTLHNLPLDISALATQLSASLFLVSGGGDDTNTPNLNPNLKEIASESVEGQSITYANKNSDNKNKSEVIGGVSLSEFQQSILRKYYLKRIIV